MNHSSQHSSYRSSEKNSEIGQRMRQIRRAARMTQQQLAEALELSVNYLGEVERGHKPLSHKLADQFCNYFNITYDYIYHGVSPASQNAVREKSRYDSVKRAINEKVSKCSPEETLIIYQMITSYLDTSAQLRQRDKPRSDVQEGSGSSGPD